MKMKSSIHARKSVKYIAAFDENSDTVFSLRGVFNVCSFQRKDSPEVILTVTPSKFLEPRHSNKGMSRQHPAWTVLFLLLLPKGSCSLHSAKN